MSDAESSTAVLIVIASPSLLSEVPAVLHPGVIFNLQWALSFRSVIEKHQLSGYTARTEGPFLGGEGGYERASTSTTSHQAKEREGRHEVCLRISSGIAASGPTAGPISRLRIDPAVAHSLLFHKKWLKPVQLADSFGVLTTYEVLT